MILFDTETTDLLKPDIADLSAQPHIIEVAMIKLDDSTYEEVDRYQALIHPGVPLDEEVHRSISGLTNADLADSPTFLELYEEVCEFYRGETKWVAHNLGFDRGVLVCELRRIGKEFAFPYPTDQICTVERTRHMKGRRMKLTELYEELTGHKLDQKHRAMSDAEALVEIATILEL